MLPLDQIFKAYDIRGTVPEQLDVEVTRACLLYTSPSPRDS